MSNFTSTNIQIDTDNPRGGLNLRFDMGSPSLQVSPTWHTAGWNLTFVRLRDVLELGQGEYYVKVITGGLENPELTALGRPFEVRSTRVNQTVLHPAKQGCLAAVFEKTVDCPENLHAVGEMTWSGPHNEALAWQSFEDKFAGIIDAFDGLDCYMATGFHLIDENGVEIAYLNPWCCGKGVDLTTHNHSRPPSDMSPAFAEVHWVFNNGTGSGGMYETAEPGATDRVRHTLGSGDEHGPYFDLDENGKPVRLANGAVKYPWHGWQGGQDDDPKQAYDYVAAFEINPDYI